MKLIMAIVNKSDSKEVVRAMMKSGFAVTKISSAGGFLKGGTTVTLMSVVMTERVQLALDIMKKTCKSRKYDMSRVESEHRAEMETAPLQSKEVVVGGANVFVLNVEENYKF